MSADEGLDLRAIQSAFERREFFLKYQPIVSLRDGRCLGAEALIRWRRSDGSTMDAGGFMPSIDRTPLSGLITYWVIDTVAAELKLSERSLRRRLTDEQTSFRDLLQEARKERAQTILSKPGISLAVAAEQLGYSDTAAFSRAFKEWTGVSPGRFLRKPEG